MDIELTTLFYQILKDLVTALFSVFGLWIAYQGLSTWKTQAKGIKEFDTAYNLRYSILKIREAIRTVRHPAIWPSEDIKAKKYIAEKYLDTDVSIDKNKDRSDSYVYEMRWEKITSASVEMESHLLAAEILWGPDIIVFVKELNEKITELSLALNQHMNDRYRTKKPEEIDAIVYRDIENKDAFSNEVEIVISRILKYLEDKVS
jgi:hypothetical protein